MAAPALGVLGKLLKGAASAEGARSLLGGATNPLDRFSGLSDRGTRLGATSREFRALERSANLSAASLERVEKALQRIVSLADKAATGDGGARGMLSMLGIMDPEALRRAPLQEQLQILDKTFERTDFLSRRLIESGQLVGDEWRLVARDVDRAAGAIRGPRGFTDAMIRRMQQVRGGLDEAMNMGLEGGSFTQLLNILFGGGGGPVGGEANAGRRAAGQFQGPAGALRQNLLQSLYSPAPNIQRGRSQMNEFLLNQQIAQAPAQQMEIQRQQLMQLERMNNNAQNIGMINFG